ncbi:MAG: hypothetical protein HW389_1718 [Bacteroidetes bacterium]|nr:hypothetical protein [Bacteroidota bacterium]
MRLRLLYRTAVGILLVTSVSLAQFTLKPSIQALGRSTPALAAGPLLLEGQSRTEKKSVIVAIGYSLILPGLGDLYASNFRTGRYFMGADVALWITYGGYRSYGRWLKQDAQTFASQHADVNFEGKGDQFSVDLGNFNSVFDYNEAKLRNRQFDLLYDPNSNFAWQWASDGDRAHYKDLRIRGDGVLRNSQFIVGAMILNRIISAISAARSVSEYNSSVPSLGSWQLSTGGAGGVITTQALELTLTREF